MSDRTLNYGKKGFAMSARMATVRVANVPNQGYALGTPIGATPDLLRPAAGVVMDLTLEWHR
jgi:hypothetical protein